MQKVRAKLSFANVMSVIAVFIALGGAGYAATRLPKNSVGTKQIKRNAVNSPKVKDSSLLAQDFAPGQLPQGDPGQPGSDAASAFIGVTVSAPESANETRFCGPSGTDNSGLGQGCFSAGAAAEALAAQGSPNATMVARDLYVRQIQAAGAGAAIAYTLRVNGSDTPVACTISDPSTTCTSGDATTSVPAGSRVALKLQSGATTPNNVVPIQFGWRATTP